MAKLNPHATAVMATKAVEAAEAEAATAVTAVTAATAALLCAQEAAAVEAGARVRA